MMLSEATTNHLIAARHLYYLAEQNIRSEQTAPLFAGVNLLQDAIEVFLWAAATFKGVGGKERAEIHQMFDDVSKSVAPHRLPFRHAFTQLNRLRINSKHYGIYPDRKEAQRLLVDMAEFLREGTELVFASDFWTISLINLLSDGLGPIKHWALCAEQDFHERSFRDCLIHCRYAIYLAFEQEYDVSPYADANYMESAFFGFTSSAPYWARNTKYIEDRVTEPCDFIVINYDHLHRRLWENGIDTTVFWNVLRLTPGVFLPREKKNALRMGGPALDKTRWVVKDDFDILDEDGIQDRAAYVLRHTIEMILSVATRNQQMKSVGGVEYKVTLKAGEIPYFAKASRRSEKKGIIPDNIRELDTSYVVQGLDGGGGELFWSIRHVDLSTSPSPTLIFGFVGNDDVERHMKVGMHPVISAWR